MKRRRFLTVGSLFIIFLFTTATTRAQPNPPTNKEILTNTKVIELVKIGLSDAIIIEKIRQTESHFDTSTSALAQLKAARVSDAIIMVLLNSQSSSAAPVVTANVTSPVVKVISPVAVSGSVGEAREPGIYLSQDGALAEINPSVFSGTKSSFWGTALTYGLKKSKVRAIVRGSTANTIVNNSRPEFYFYFDKSYSNSGAVMAGFLAFGATSPAEFVLVKMEQKSKSREAVLGEFNAYGSSTGARDKDIQDFSFEKVRPGVFKVVPRANLAPGEYSFYYAGTPAGLGFAGGKLFDFSVPSLQ